MHVLGQPVDEDMSSEAHIIDIESIVVTGVDQRQPGNLSDLIETEVLRALEGAGLDMPTGFANNETRVAGGMARTVVRPIQGWSGRV